MSPTRPADVRAAHSVEDELLRLLASTTAVRDREEPRIAALLEQVNYGSLWRAMHAQKSTPLFGHRLMAVPGCRVSAELRARIEQASAAARARGLAFEALTVRLVRALGDGGVPALPLKGAVLADRVHGDTGLRLASDIDILVAPEHLPAATAVMLDQGYAPPRDPRWHSELPLLHETFVAPADWRPPVELHWRVHWYEEGFARALLARSLPDERFGRVAAPADDFAALLLFYARDSFQGLRLPADIAAWWDRYGGRLPDGALEPIVRAHPGLAPSLTAAAAVVEEVVGVPATRFLPAARRLRGRAAIAARLRNWGSHLPDDQVVAETTLVDLLLAPRRERRGWARRNIVQPLDHIAAARDLEDRPRAELALRAAAHAAAVTARFTPRYARALARTASQDAGRATEARAAAPAGKPGARRRRR